MGIYVKSHNANLFNGVLKTVIEFSEGLNILSGENGTGKTQVLIAIKAGKNIQSSDASAPRIQAFSPKRNAERKNTEKILEEIRQQNKRLPNYIQDLAKAALQDSTFVNYDPFGKVYFYLYEEECKDGGKQIEKNEKSDS